jgi:hypothetical protein
LHLSSLEGILADGNLSYQASYGLSVNQHHLSHYVLTRLVLSWVDR